MSLAAGEKALMYALSGVMRSDASRSNYALQIVKITIGGVARKVIHHSVTIQDHQHNTPNTAMLTVYDARPSEGAEIVITLGGSRLFAGNIVRVTEAIAVQNPSNPRNILWHTEAIDWTWQLNQKLILYRYQAASATAIVWDLVARFGPPGYVAAAAPGLPVIDEITFTNETFANALSRLAQRIGGYTKVDYYQQVLLWIGEQEQPPSPITWDLRSFKGMTYARDLSQIVTRALVEGGGVNAIIDVPPGAAEIPVDDGAWYSASGGFLVAGPQRLYYTGKSADEDRGTTTTGGAAGSSPIATPGGLSAAQGSSSGNLRAGTYQYAQTIVNGAGEESHAGAIASGAIAALSAPPTNPSGSAVPNVPGNLIAGVTYQYACTWITPSGETTIGPTSVGLTIPALPSPGSVSLLAQQVTGGRMAPPTSGWYYHYVVRFVADNNDHGNYGSWNNVTFGAPNNAVNVTGIPTSSDGRVTERRLYRNLSPGSGGTYYLVAIIPDNTTTTFLDLAHQSELTTLDNPTAKASGKMALTSIPVPGGGTRITGRRVYRTAAGGGALYLLATIGNITATTLTDNTPDDQLLLGSNPPTADTASPGTMALSSIAPGNADTVRRNLYRTPAGGGDLKYFGTISNNTATTYTDNTPDTSLGKAPPPSSEWGQKAAAVPPTPAGATSLGVVDLAPLTEAPGWVRVGNQLIRYTSKSGATGAGTLYGIPATGRGALVSAVNAGTPVVGAAFLKGLPPVGGAGAILYTIKNGDPVNVLILVDDVAAQAALAALLGGGASGIQESYKQDRRLSIAECYAEANALLARSKDPLVTVRYKTTDAQTVSGAIVTITLGAPVNVSGSFRIQDVTISGFTADGKKNPNYDVVASSQRFTFEDLIRQMRK